MAARKFGYSWVDGDHFPDANKGDNLYYAIDCSCWLTNERDTLESAAWVVPSELTASDDYIDNDQAIVKLGTPVVGSFTVKCIISTIDNGKTQSKVIPMVIKVR